jgi:hypothetical protein
MRNGNIMAMGLLAVLIAVLAWEFAHAAFGVWTPW